VSRAWFTILLAGAGTFAMRASFLVLAGRLADLPPTAHRVLRQIPPAALSALVLPALLRPGGELALWQPHLAAGVLAALVSWRTRNIVATLVVGLTALGVLQQL
jgi:branched-subunit amino acid transport protein